MKTKEQKQQNENQTNNLHIYYIEEASEKGLHRYNYSLFAEFLGLPYSTTKRYLSGGAIQDERTCRAIERAMGKPEGDIDIVRPEVGWPLESGYWNHPKHKVPKRPLIVTDDMTSMAAEEIHSTSLPCEWNLEQQNELRQHLNSHRLHEILAEDEVIYRFMNGLGFDS